jgi:GNAT superfamily N-acetyltransferase
MMTAAPLIPSAGEDVVLHDGTQVRIRPIEEGDADRLVSFHNGLSQETVYRRFFNLHTKLAPSEIHRFTHVDGHDRVALIGLVGSEMVGVGRYDRMADRPDMAEVSFVVADRHHGHGLGGMLLHHLVPFARAAGITTFYAQTMLDNLPMQEVFRHSGIPYRCQFRNGLAEYRLSIE